jgi:outer membrane protein TolC
MGLLKLAGLVVVTFCCAGVGSSVAAGPPRQEKLVVTVNEAIVRALAQAPELGESQADIALAESRLTEAGAYRFPRIEFLSLLGPAPQANKLDFNRPDTGYGLSHLTWFASGDILVTQPLYTFGKISENMKAAGHGIEVDRAKKEQRRNEIAQKVREYYYGLLFARQMKGLVQEIQGHLDTARASARKLLDQGSANVDELDMYKLDAFTGEAAKFLDEANRGEQLALAALRARLGLSPTADLEIADEQLSVGTAQVHDLSVYLAEAENRRPEYRQLREGLKARAALVEAAQANFYPDIFLGAFYSAAYSQDRDKINNPYVSDTFRHNWGGVALGLKWHVDFGITGAKVAAEQAQYERLLKTREYAETNIPLQVRKFYLELVEAKNSAESTKSAWSSARKWTVAAVANFDFGIGPARDIFEGLQNYARMKGEYFQSLYNFRIAEANLLMATGQPPGER